MKISVVLGQDVIMTDLQARKKYPEVRFYLQSSTPQRMEFGTESVLHPFLEKENSQPKTQEFKALA
jgi:hypothetical protein